MSLFWVKKFLTPFLMPLLLVVYCLAAGVGLLWFSRRQRLGKMLVSAGLLLLLALSCEVVSNSLLRNLEDNYPVLSHPDRSIKWVAVLGGGHNFDPAFPLFDSATPKSMVRVFEGVRLYREIPNGRLILCGGGFDGDTDAAGHGPGRPRRGRTRGASGAGIGIIGYRTASVGLKETGGNRAVCLGHIRLTHESCHGSL